MRLGPVRRPPRRSWLLVLLAAAVLLGLAVSAGHRTLWPAATPLPVPGAGDRYVAEGDLVIAANEVVEHDAIALNGDVTVLPGALVKHDVFAANGAIEIAGRVEHDVRALNGDVTLRQTAWVGHTVEAANGTVHREPGSTVTTLISGQSADAAPARGAGLLGFLLRLVLSLILGAVFVALGLLVTLVWPRPTGRIAQVLDDAPGPTAVVGLITGVFILPVLLLCSVVLAITIVGILLIPVLWLGLLVGWFYGLVVAGLWAGRRLAGSGHLPWAHGSLLRATGVGLTLVAAIGLLPGVVVPWGLAWLPGYFLGFLGLGAALLHRLSQQTGSVRLGPLHGPAITRPLSKPPDRWAS